MDNTQVNIQGESTNIFENKNLIIIVLIILLLLAILGINLLSLSGNLLQTITNIFGPLITQIIGFFGYTTGTVLNKTADVVSDTAKMGIDIADGTVHSVGNLLKDGSSSSISDYTRSLDDAINNASILHKFPPTQAPAQAPTTHGPTSPEPDKSQNPIQNPITASKTSWCLVGEYQSKRGCIEIGESDKCISGRVYPSQQMCLNPTMTQK